MSNRFVCTKCKRNITDDELTLAKVIKTRYDNKVHSFCPYCDSHITSFKNDSYETIFSNLSKIFRNFGCTLICYYEGSVEIGCNSIDYKPPIFRITDTNNRLFYRFVSKLKHVNEIQLDDIFIIDEKDGSFSIIGGTETWYFDSESANADLNKYLVLIKKIIGSIIRFGNKYINRGV